MERTIGVEVRKDWLCAGKLRSQSFLETRESPQGVASLAFAWYHKFARATRVKRETPAMARRRFAGQLVDCGRERDFQRV
jgi:hypothetical protein